MSHDLAQPLSVIAGLSYALRTRLGGAIDEASLHSLDKLDATVHRMGDLTQDLLRFSRAAQQALRVEDVDLGEMAWQVARSLQAQDPRRHADWRIPPHAVVRGDPGLLRVVLDNLLGNAWKYTGRQERARIDVRIRPGPPAAVEVADNGVGFEPGEAGDLFQAFVRLPSSQGFPGTGVGLATVRRIVERHGGRVTAEGRPGHGATVRFTLGPPPPGFAAA